MAGASFAVARPTPSERSPAPYPPQLVPVPAEHLSQSETYAPALSRKDQRLESHGNYGQPLTRQSVQEPARRVDDYPMYEAHPHRQYPTSASLPTQYNPVIYTPQYPG